MYEYIFNIVACLSNSHTSIFGLPQSQLSTSLLLSARILNQEIIKFSPACLEESGDKKNKKQIVVINAEELNHQVLEKLRLLICEEHSWLNKKYTVVLKFSISEEEKTEKL